MTLSGPADSALLTLLSGYIHICNEAMDHNCERFPYKQIWEAVELDRLKLKIGVTILDNDNRFFATMIMRNGELSLMPDTCCGCSKCYGEERFWSVSKELLEAVVRHSQLYITQPARLDWEWLNPGDFHLSPQGKPELQAEHAYSDSCSKDLA